MAGVLVTFRSWGFMYALTLVPLVAYMIMHHPDYTAQAEEVRQMLAPIENAEVRDQMLVPMTMTLYMPLGLMGAFAAVMLVPGLGNLTLLDRDEPRFAEAAG